MVIGAGSQQFVEVQHTFRHGRALGLHGTALRLWQQVRQIDGHDSRQLWQALAQRGDLLPQVSTGERRQGDQHRGIGSADQFGDVLRLQQRIDGIDDPGRFATPDDKVGVWQVG
ncbi:hypothetical protein D3C84_654460 [compost metagenome]